MRRLIPVLIIIILGSACKKTVSLLSWERTYGPGNASYIMSASDSGLIACGEADNQPCLIRLDRNKMTVLDVRAEMSGVFTSVWYDTSGYISGGSTDSRMLLMRHSKTGNKLWDKSIDPGFNVDLTQILYTGNGTFIAIGSASPDKDYNVVSGLLFLSFDSTGQVISEQKYFSGFFTASGSADTDNSGNIYLALTRREINSKQKATIAKFNNEFQLIWEVELANNPAYGAAATAVRHDGAGKVYAAGRTEVPTDGGALNNSFIVSLTDGGSVNWKKYPESSNTGASVLINAADEVLLLNKNCFIVNILDRDNGADGGRVRMFDICDPYNTNATGSDFDMTYNGDIILAGSNSGSFYLAVKSLR
jgi:hypothetical protein